MRIGQSEPVTQNMDADSSLIGIGHLRDVTQCPYAGPNPTPLANPFMSPNRPLPAALIRIGHDVAVTQSVNADPTPIPLATRGLSPNALLPAAPIGIGQTSIVTTQSSAADPDSILLANLTMPPNTLLPAAPIGIGHGMHVTQSLFADPNHLPLAISALTSERRLPAALIQLLLTMPDVSLKRRMSAVGIGQSSIVTQARCADPTPIPLANLSLSPTTPMPAAPIINTCRAANGAHRSAPQGDAGVREWNGNISLASIRNWPEIPCHPFPACRFRSSLRVAIRPLSPINTVPLANVFWNWPQPGCHPIKICRFQTPYERPN